MNLDYLPWVGPECRGGRGFALHEVAVPVFGVKGSYTQGVSIEAFRVREMRISNKQEKVRTTVPTPRWLVDRALTHKIMVKLAADRGEEIKEHPNHIIYNWLPRFQHESVWKFYETIGYDHKKKKYVRQPSLTEYGAVVAPYTGREMTAIAAVYWKE